jgi:hypothetical protein
MYYTFPSKGLGVPNEIPGWIQIIARQVNFGLTKTVKRPSTLRGNSNIGSESADTEADTFQTSALISLPMPQNLLYAQAAGYNTENVGATGAAVADATNSSSLSDLVANKGAGLLSGVLTDLSSIVKNPLQLAKGVVANPFSFTMFGSMAHRTFNYSWVFAPRNEIESNEIKAICDALSYFQLPGRDTEGFLQFLEIPLQFDIDYWWMNGPDAYLEQPNRSVLSNITVNYGGTTRAQRHINGAPIEIGLDLTFVEVEPLIRNKIGHSDTLTGGDKIKAAEIKTQKSITKFKSGGYMDGVI